MATYGNSREAFTDEDGNPIQGGKLYIGQPDQDPKATAGSTTITDLNDVAIGNPVTLDSLGVPEIAFKVSDDYSQAVYDKNDVEVTSYQIARTGGFLTSADVGNATTNTAPWVITKTYGKADVARGSDLNYYISLTNNNLGNDPTVSSTSWSRLAWPTLYNLAETYNTDDACMGSDGATYKSKVDNNTGNDPVTDGGVNWTDGLAGANASITALTAALGLRKVINIKWDVTTVEEARAQVWPVGSVPVYGSLTPVMNVDYEPLIDGSDLLVFSLSSVGSSSTYPMCAIFVDKSLPADTSLCSDFSAAAADYPNTVTPVGEILAVNEGQTYVIEAKIGSNAGTAYLNRSSSGNNLGGNIQSVLIVAEVIA